MIFQSIAALAALLPATALAQYAGNNTTAMPNGKYQISAEGITANFIPYGASISNLFITDVHGEQRDIVLGFDNASYYSVDKQHPHLGGVPGRYANRIKNGTFEIDGVTYHTDLNEHGGLNTLHGGNNGWDWRNWTVVSHTKDSITFSLLDPDGTEGFPGDVLSIVQYTLTPHQWHFKMTAFSLTKKTPIMLSSHTYWNLDGFQNPSTPTALNHTLHLPYSGQRIGCDGNLIPDGTTLPNQQYSVNDFWSSPKQFGANQTAPELKGNCGTNCTGYDTAYLVNRDQLGPYDWKTEGSVATLASPYTGIQVDVFSGQQAFQIYNCNGMNGSLALKNTQGFFDNSTHPRTVSKYGCIVMEVEDWIDAINQPEWQRKQIYGPADEPYVLEATYKFSLNHTLAGHGKSTSH